MNCKGLKRVYPFLISKIHFPIKPRRIPHPQLPCRYILGHYAPCGDECILTDGYTRQNHTSCPYGSPFAHPCLQQCPVFILRPGEHIIGKGNVRAYHHIILQRDAIPNLYPTLDGDIISYLHIVSIRQCEQILQFSPILHFGNTTQNYQILVLSGTFWFIQSANLCIISLIASGLVPKTNITVFI